MQRLNRDPRRPLQALLACEDELDVLLVNPESTFVSAPSSEITMPDELKFLSSEEGSRLLGDQDHEPNHGLLHVAALLLSSGLSVDVLDLNSIAFLSRSGADMPRDLKDLLLEVVVRRRPRIVGFSAMIPNLAIAKEYSRALRAEDPRVIQILGGLATESSAVEREASFDVVFRGQAEDGLLPLVESLLDRHVGRTVHLGKSRDARVPRSQEVYAAYDLLPLELPLIPRVFASKGCAARCGFCSPAAALNYGVNIRSATETLAEIVWLHETFEFDFWLLGDLTLFLKSKDIRTLIRNDLPKLALKPWWCQTQVALTSEDIFSA